MDQLSAHLDRGWDLIQRGDLPGAQASARRALQTDPNSPEAHNLMGYITAQIGDADDALEHYRQAMALDDGYIDPMLNAAEVLIHPLHEYDEAVALCDEVLEFVEAREETADALLLKFDALLGKGDREAARKLLADLPEGMLEGPTYPFLIGRAMFESGEAEKAEPYLRAAVANDPRNPDAHYYVGLVLDERGDQRGATLSFLESREIELHLEPPSWSPSREVFQKSVERALTQLEPGLVKQLAESVVLVSDMPGMEIVAEGVDPHAPVLLDGVAAPGEAGPLAARVFVYQRNIERLCAGIEQLDEEIAFQLTEEVKHLVEHRAREDAGEIDDEGKPASDVARPRPVRVPVPAAQLEKAGAAAENAVDQPAAPAAKADGKTSAKAPAKAADPAPEKPTARPRRGKK